MAELPDAVQILWMLHVDYTGGALSAVRHWALLPCRLNSQFYAKVVVAL